MSEAQWRSSLATYVLPAIGSKRVDEITTADVMACLAPIWTTKAETAKRVRQRIRAVMKWAPRVTARTTPPQRGAQRAVRQTGRVRTAGAWMVGGRFGPAVGWEHSVLVSWWRVRGCRLGPLLGVVIAVLLVLSVAAHPGTSVALPSGVSDGDHLNLSGVAAGSGDLASGGGLSGGGFGVPVAFVLSGGVAGGGPLFAQGTENPPAANAFPLLAQAARVRVGYVPVGKWSAGAPTSSGRRLVRWVGRFASC